ncbi:signal transduction histidine kinase [Streptosporangium becharense]|uniref:histidine kinase n=1 Tax=Streptosporangium becharense TaxID=1816182 RepID=A0A7W9IEC2_9ACTN|nr:sensor histidine kinase [Streptosporangium becharense]MBB2909918.1 signal transduction histidine kinase [Streptosporangium becharense]MBB5819127.1 signal transduction histidine kinase [Streptosporangium becharense]
MTVETAGTHAGRTPLRRRVPLGPYGPLGVIVDPVTWRALPYLLVSPLYGLACFVFLVTAIPVSLVLTVVWVGLPLLALTVLAWRAAAMVERRLLRLAFAVRIPDPYRSTGGRNLLLRCKDMAGDPATWKDLVYLSLLLPIGLAELTVVVVLWVMAFGLTVVPLPLVLGGNTLTVLGGVPIATVPEALLCLPAGIAFFFVAVYATRGTAWLHGALATALLGVGRNDRLAARAAHLRASRARGVDAAEAERRRIERDLHDGAQQRLLSVAMDLGRAQAKLDSDPESARELLAQAHTGTKAAIAELRDLARGIHPAILTDRGLGAALSSLASRAPVRVDLSVEISHRPPPAVESIAYFVVAESLTNMAKHSGATEGSVRVGRHGQRVIVEIVDNGVGAAVPRPGGGLAGLADRAATIDGTLSVDSPPGGPTTVRAELPCEW